MRGSIRVIPEKGRAIGTPQGEEEARRGTRTRDGVAGLSANKNSEEQRRIGRAIPGSRDEAVQAENCEAPKTHERNRTGAINYDQPGSRTQDRSKASQPWEKAREQAIREDECWSRGEHSEGHNLKGDTELVVSRKRSRA
jgi:hypothetical protein